MELRIAHPLLHDEGSPLDFILSSGHKVGEYGCSFEGERLCQDVELEVAISAMLDHVATAAIKEKGEKC